MEIIFPNPKVEKFLESIEAETRSAIDDGFLLLSEMGHTLRMPLSKPLGNGLFELRIIRSGHVRFIYTFRNNCACILHGFLKKSNKIPKRDLDYAKRQLYRLL